MPALVTHYLFGEEVLHRLEANLCPTDEARDLFLMGCQGPDPFFFAVTTSRGATVRSMGSNMHRRRVSATFDRLRADVALLPEGDQELGRAFTAGLLAHYVLDRNAHPFVYAHEYELCDYNRELADAYHEVHAVIESDLDCGMLDHLRGVSCERFAPASVLQSGPEALLVAGTLLAQAARAVFSLDVRPTDYSGAVADMRLCYQAIEPFGSPRQRNIARAERLARPHSQLAALSHRTDLGADNPSMNMGRLPWADPFKDARSSESFPEVFERGVEDYLGVFAAFEAGLPMAPLTAGLDYHGKPMDGREEPLGSTHPL